jgi:hypothetical protein
VFSAGAATVFSAGAATAAVSFSVVSTIFGNRDGVLLF